MRLGAVAVAGALWACSGSCGSGAAAPPPPALPAAVAGPRGTPIAVGRTPARAGLSSVPRAPQPPPIGRSAAAPGAPDSLRSPAPARPPLLLLLHSGLPVVVGAVLGAFGVRRRRHWGTGAGESAFLAVATDHVLSTPETASRLKKPKSPALTLSEEARILTPLLQFCKDEYDAGRLADYDFAGAFLLAYAALRRPGAWAGGRLRPSSPPLPTGPSRAVASIPGLLPLLGEAYLSRKLGVPAADVALMDPFAALHFVGMKKSSKRATADPYLNAAVTGWSCGTRRFLLMFHIPTPSQVLRQQATGQRVVTLFMRPEELATTHVGLLAYMEDGGRVHERDAFEFLLHDLKHMENFVDPEIHLEQVGFFHSLVRLGESCGDGRLRLRHFFCEEWGLDQQLWDELEYVISDMNCYVCHLLQYTLAKVIRAVERKLQRLPEGRGPEDARLHAAVTAVWDAVLRGAGVTGDALEAARGMVATASRLRGPLTAEEGEALRRHFRAIGHAMCTPTVPPPTLPRPGLLPSAPT